jgi:hypothetical protein
MSKRNPESSKAKDIASIFRDAGFGSLAIFLVVAEWDQEKAIRASSHKMLESYREIWLQVPETVDRIRKIEDALDYLILEIDKK